MLPLILSLVTALPPQAPMPPQAPPMKAPCLCLGDPGSPLCTCADCDCVHYEWRTIDGTQASLWRNGKQVGNYVFATGAYYPRLAPGKWGEKTRVPVSWVPATPAATAPGNVRWEAPPVFAQPFAAPAMRGCSSGG